MIRTVGAMVDEQGTARPLENIDLPKVSRALVTKVVEHPGVRATP